MRYRITSGDEAPDALLDRITRDLTRSDGGAPQRRDHLIQVGDSIPQLAANGGSCTFDNETAFGYRLALHRLTQFSTSVLLRPPPVPIVAQLLG